MWWRKIVVWLRGVLRRFTVELFWTKSEMDIDESVKKILKEEALKRLITINEIIVENLKNKKE